MQGIVTWFISFNLLKNHGRERLATITVQLHSYLRTEQAKMN